MSRVMNIGILGLVASHGNHVPLLPGEESVITWTARCLEDRTRPDTACAALRVHCNGLNAGEALSKA